MDYPYDRMQWAGEEYVLENLMEEITLEKFPEIIIPEKRYTGWGMCIGIGIFIPVRAAGRFTPRQTGL